MRRGGVVLGLLVALVVLVLVVWGSCGGAGLTRPAFVGCVRDVAIIILMLETFVVTMLLLVIVGLFGQLINTVRNEIMPILNSAQRTANIVQGTTHFVTDTVVAPIINLAGMGAGLRGTLMALLARRKKGGVQNERQ